MMRALPPAAAWGPQGSWCSMTRHGQSELGAHRGLCCPVSPFPYLKNSTDTTPLAHKELKGSKYCRYETSPEASHSVDSLWDEEQI